jgi:sporulation protein YlmC with PRC-barrel domain
MRRSMIVAAAVALGAGAALAQPATGEAPTPVAPAGAETPAGTATARPGAPSMPSEGGLAVTEGMVGREVLGRDGQALGRVADVILSPDGQPRQVVLAGADGREVAVEVAEIRMQTDRSEVQASTLTREQVAALPEFRFDEGSMISWNRSRGEGTTPPGQD